MKRKRKPNAKINRRVQIVLIGFSACFLLLITMAVNIQVIRGPELHRIAQRQIERKVDANLPRGKILDATREELALTLEGFAIGAHPQKVRDKAAVGRQLAKVLKVNRRALSKKLKKNTPFVWVKRPVSPLEADRVAKLNISDQGVVIIPAQLRSYPNRSLAAQVIGFTGVDNKGLEGVEFYYNQSLAAQVNKVRKHIDARGKAFDFETPPSPDLAGNTVILTLDRKIQYFTESALGQAVTTHRAKSGLAIVMEPQTGAVLAMANYPAFNPNNLGKFNDSQSRNRSITDPYEPGSTLKMFTAAAALEQKAGSVSSIFYCENGRYAIGRRVVRDTHEYGWLSLLQIVKYSSNIGAVKLLESMGKEALYQTLRDFGFGERTGIDLPGETSGRLRDYRRWRKIDAGNIAFGQGISVSAIQLVAATAAIANGGLLMKPRVVAVIENSLGEVIKEFKPTVVRRVISRETAAAMRRILLTVTTEGGTGVNAALKGYGVCGKTGTAQKYDPIEGYKSDKYISSFIGFVPSDRPRLVILVALDEPFKKHYGGTVAAPAFRDIARATLNYLNVSPQPVSPNLTALSVDKGVGG